MSHTEGEPCPNCGLPVGEEPGSGDLPCNVCGQGMGMNWTPNGGTPEMFSSELIIDVDEGQHGWEIVVRFGPDDMVVGWTDIDDAELLTLAPNIGAAVVEAILAERDTGRRVS